jgi:hypothetical protein
VCWYFIHAPYVCQAEVVMDVINGTCLPNISMACLISCVP